jgi:hypothetical protein
MSGAVARGEMMKSPDWQEMKEQQQAKDELAGVGA